MPPTVTDEKLGEAILESAKHGTFPQSEQLASATVPQTALPNLIETVRAAREETKVSYQGPAKMMELTKG